MNRIKKSKVILIISGICGVWFLLSGASWIYWAALFFSYPFAIIGFVLWVIGKKLNPSDKLIKPILILYGVALTLSLLVLLFLE